MKTEDIPAVVLPEPDYVGRDSPEWAQWREANERERVRLASLQHPKVTLWGALCCRMGRHDVAGNGSWGIRCQRCGLTGFSYGGDYWYDR